MDEPGRVRQVQLAAQGDAEALQRLIVHYHPPLRTLLDARLSTALRRYIDPDDILQEAYVAAFQALRSRSGRAKRGAGSSGEQADEAADTPATSAGRPAKESDDGSAISHAFDSPESFFNWLATIAINRLKDQQRAWQRQKRDVRRQASASPGLSASYLTLAGQLSAGQPTPSRQLATDEAIAAVMSSLARLTAEQRAVIRLRYLEGRSVAEVAAALD
ncbi:MAG: sigma-70 family RNA polymerase sigma factor, partial [Planctomycetes bacterium]|nr:sigma-70 family RNA polymerase sigma factor [Planctomycetota bacterium]